MIWLIFIAVVILFRVLRHLPPTQRRPPEGAPRRP